MNTFWDFKILVVALALVISSYLKQIFFIFDFLNGIDPFLPVIVS